MRAENEKLDGILKKGDQLYSPRFGNIKLDMIFRNVEEMMAAGYKEGTMIVHGNWRVFGKLSDDMMHILFAAAPLGKVFAVTIEETSSKTVFVIAKDGEDAEDIARYHWDNSDDGYILDAEDFNAVDFFAVESEEVLAV